MDEVVDVAVIAPEAPGLPRLDAWTEIAEIGNIEGVNLTILGKGNATLSAVAQLLRRRHDVVMWSGHGRENGLILSDGSEVDGEWLATQAKCGAPRLMVLAACLSSCANLELESLTNELSRVGINAVGMLTRVEDRACIAYDIEIVRALRAGADVGQAHRVAAKRMDKACPGAGCDAILVPGLTNGYRFIVDRMDGFEQRLGIIEGMVREVKTLLEGRRRR